MWNEEVYNLDCNEDYPPIDYNKAKSESESEEEIELVAEFNNSSSSSDLKKRKFSPEINLCSVSTKDNLQTGKTSCAFDTKQKSRTDVLQAKKLKNLDKVEEKKLREEKKAEELRQKALKKVLAENQRNLKPEENIKFLKVHIDNEIINSFYGGNIISLLQQNSLQYEINSHQKSNTIFWSKKKLVKMVDDVGSIIEKIEATEECELLYILEWQQAVELVHKMELLTHIETIKSVFLDKKVTLLICGLEKYFDFKKKKKNREMKAEINDKKISKLKPDERLYDTAPNISKSDLEFALCDLQLRGKHNCRFIEKPEELAELVLNFTKSLSKIEFKLEKQKRQEENDCWFIPDKSNQSVKVNKINEGLSQLWQQQLCQFNNVGLETAQAIIYHYNSPSALMAAYEKCDSVADGELLLENIQVRRAAEILSSSRRVGPQLSKKIYRFFTSDDPEAEL